MANVIVADITGGGALSPNAKSRQIAIDSNDRLFVTYSKIPGGYTYSQIYIAYSDDDGATWTEEQVGSSDVANESNPAIAVDSSNILHLVFDSAGRAPFTSDRGIFYMQRSAAGAWSAEETVQLLDVGAAEGQEWASAAVDSNDYIHVVWEGEDATSTREIKYRRRAVGSWGDVEVVATSATGAQTGAALAVDSSDNLHVVWSGKGWGTNTSVYNIRYREKTIAWQTAEAVTDTTETQELSSISIDSSDVLHVAWDGKTWGTNTTIKNVQYRQKTGSWQTVERVTDEAYQNRYPSIAVDSGDDVFVSWDADTPTSTGEAYIRERSGSWGTVGHITEGLAYTQVASSLLWAMHPTGNAIANYMVVWEQQSNNVYFGYPVAPTATTQAVSNIAATTSTGNGNVTALGGPYPTAHGVCYNTTGSPTTADDSTDEGAVTATGAFTSSMTSLSINTKYYVKAYATNIAGTSYGSEVNFTTLGVPTIITQTCESVVGATATGRGDITVIGNPTPTAHGHCWNTTADPVITDDVVDNGAASVIGTFISSITGLTPGTGYWTRAYATNTQGTVYGANVYFVASTGRAGYTWDESSNLRSFDENAIERQYIHTNDVDDTPANGATTDPISSNWAYDHVAAADPHTGYVLESLFDAQTILRATSDNTPTALTLTEQTLAGRLTGGNISAVALGISDNNVAQIDGTTNAPANLDYAKFTTAGLEGRSYQELVNDISGVIKATDVEVSELSTATYDDAQDYINFFGDRTLITGGGITDNGNGTAAVAAGKAWAKATDSDTAVGKFFDFSADNSVSLTDLITNYVYLDYNAGTPQIVVSTSITTHGFKQDHIHIATIFRNGATLHFHEEDAIGIGRINIADMHLLELRDAERVSGLVTSDNGSLSLSITSGVLYEGLNRHTTTVDGSTWSYWYTSDSGTTWTEDTDISALVQSYNDITSGKVSLGTGKYGVHWVYCDIDGENLFIIYGQGNYNANEAEEAAVPSVLPDIAVHYGVLIAKIINREGTNTLTISYPWTSVFTSSLATDHNSLANLTTGDVHTQYFLLAGETTAAQLHSGADLIVYSDAGSTEVARIDGATGAITTSSTLNTHTIPSGTDTICLIAATQELDNKTLDSSTAKGTWGVSGTWTIPAVTLSGNVSGGGYNLNNVGRIGLINAGSSSQVGLYHNETRTVAADWVGGYYALLEGYRTDASFTQYLTGYRALARVGSANTQLWTNTIGVRGISSEVHIETGTASSTTITGAANICALAPTIGASANDMVLTNYYGLYVGARTLIGNSKLTNNYGIYVGAQAGGSTLNYAIYTAGGSVYHVGDLTAANIITAGNVDGVDVSEVPAQSLTFALCS